MHVLVEWREFNSDCTEITVAAFQFFHAIALSRIDRYKEQQPFRRARDMRGDGVIRNVPARRLGLQPEDHCDVRFARRFEMSLADIAPGRCVHATPRHVRAQTWSKVEFRPEKMSVDVNNHFVTLPFNASSGSEASGVKSDPSA
jgi:hypothetical protein